MARFFSRFCIPLAKLDEESENSSTYLVDQLVFFFCCIIILDIFELWFHCQNSDGDGRRNKEALSSNVDASSELFPHMTQTIESQRNEIFIRELEREWLQSTFIRM